MSHRHTTMHLGDEKNPAQGTVPGARIDAAVEQAVEAFWHTFSEAFPEAQFGDMGPGDTTEFEDAALRVARIWVMWNVPGGMPEDPDEVVGATTAQGWESSDEDSVNGTVEDIRPGTPEWDESEVALERQRRAGL